MVGIADAPTASATGECRGDVSLAKSEIQNLGLPTLGHEDVRRLDVAMHDALGVRRIQRVGKLDAQVQNFVGLEGLGADAVLEGLPLQQFHGDERPAFVLVDVVDGADVGVIEGGGGLGLALEALQGLMVLGHFFRQELERDEAMELGVLGLIDDTHTAASELLQHAIVGNRLANHE